ncbi:5-hydroxytryptamine receptor isoform X1 [Drosophila novamexicana]|uniref:5-hydroxytryptamine receptor isoform X1 n=2 Tax=Drosophila novamexicana TaxID=47314 RepID=UPI0011E601DD|nr:5-hydroxytryptamine receptor isoform X1 [Drosophila novamexicana]XP_030568160.1 5-hydroxytryptamine receptor isoform X1 [Drosophila novamexicana]XP_030568161.1 5-hydroxytryptamine receptor isoform X1 [Drosophila novamexicana]
MALHSQLEYQNVLIPPLMYVATTFLATSGVIGLQQNVSIGYDNFLETWSIGNRSLSPTSYTSGIPSLQSKLNDSGNFGDSVPTLTLFNYYNESAATAEWAHFYDLILSWQGICLIAVFCTFIIVTVIGNTLIILAVLTTRRLRTVTNCFVMSLAIADLLVGIFVMPPAVAVHLIGSWQLGWVLCDIWISFDVLLCTASILSLCAISVDRYLAVTQPLTYSRKRRSKRLALLMILIVWILALAITCPPMLGWYEPGRRDLRECRYNQNEGYVIFSAMGSFFIPMAVMIYVYAKISCVIAKRHDNMSDINVHNKKFKRYTAADVENEFSEQEHSTGYKSKQAAAQTFFNQRISKDLHEIVLSNSDNLGVPTSDGVNAGNCQTLLALPSTHNASGKNGCYELTRPSSLSLKRTSTASTTITTMASGVGPSSSLLDAPWQSQPQQQPPTHSFRHSHLSVGGGDRLRGHHHHPSAGSGTADVSTTTSTNIKSLSNRITSLKKENKTTQTLSIVVGGFIACWLPFFVYYLITPFLAEHQVSGTLAKALTWLGWFNSAINPFIYAFYSVDFRAAFWRLTCKRFFSDDQKPQFPTNTMSIRR